MNQTHKDLAKKRREYLAKKAQMVLTKYTGLIAMLGCGGLFLFSLVSAAAMAWAFIKTRDETSPTWLIALFAAVFLASCGAVLLLFGTVTLFLASFCVSADGEVKSIPYVPPVDEQIAVLPADQILVRGSELPSAAPDELLRAAREGTGTAQRELLRPQTNSTEEQLVSSFARSSPDIFTQGRPKFFGQGGPKLNSEGNRQERAFSHLRAVRQDARSLSQIKWEDHLL